MAGALADEQFGSETIVKGLSATVANRFHLQIETVRGQALLGIGSIAVVGGRRAGGEIFADPAVAVHQVYRVDVDFLRALVDTITGLLGDQAEQTPDVGSDAT